MRPRRSPAAVGDSAVVASRSGPRTGAVTPDRSAAGPPTLDAPAPDAPKSDKTESAGPQRPERRRLGFWLRHRLLAPLLAGVLVFGVGLTVVEQLPTSYATTSTISFAPRTTPLVNADVIELIAQKYAVVASASTTVNSAAEASGVTPADLRDGLAVTVEQGTANLDITVALDSADQAATAGNTIADVVDRAVRDDRLVSGEITDRADPDAAELNPPRAMLRFLVVAAALLAAGWVGFAIRQVGRRPGRTP